MGVTTWRVPLIVAKHLNIPMSQILNNHLRRHRRRAGFSQAEIAFLLGGRAGSIACRHEECVRQPKLETALAYQAIHGVAVSDLFPSTYRKVENKVLRRARVLHRVVRRAPTSPLQRAKLAALRLIVGPQLKDRPD